MFIICQILLFAILQSLCIGRTHVTPHLLEFEQTQLVRLAWARWGFLERGFLQKYRRYCSLFLWLSSSSGHRHSTCGLLCKLLTLLPDPILVQLTVHPPPYSQSGLCKTKIRLEIKICECIFTAIRLKCFLPWSTMSYRRQSLSSSPISFPVILPHTPAHLLCSWTHKVIPNSGYLSLIIPLLWTFLEHYPPSPPLYPYGWPSHHSGLKSNVPSQRGLTRTC